MSVCMHACMYVSMFSCVYAAMVSNAARCQATASSVAPIAGYPHVSSKLGRSIENTSLQSNRLLLQSHDTFYARGTCVRACVHGVKDSIAGFKHHIIILSSLHHYIIITSFVLIAFAFWSIRLRAFLRSMLTTKHTRVFTRCFVYGPPF